MTVTEVKGFDAKRDREVYRGMGYQVISAR